MTQSAKTGPRKLRTSFVLFLALIVASCASSGGGAEKKLDESLKVSIDAFNTAFRWEDYAAAANFIPPGQKDQFWAEVDRFKGKIRIIEFSLREVELKDKGKDLSKDKNTSATANMHFEFWRLDSPTLQRVNLTQKWFYTGKDRLWKVIDPGFGVMTRAVFN